MTRQRTPKIRVLGAVAFALAVLTVLIAFAAGTRAVAQEKVLYSFGPANRSEGGPHPGGGLTFDATGNLYGTTGLGGGHSQGAVYELMPTAHGSWRQKLLHGFKYDGTDGQYPNGNLVLDAAGNVYGTTYSGGAYLWGTVFELIPSPDGTWTEKVLHSFDLTSDGGLPLAGVVFDAAGNLYGTTRLGSVFKLTPAADGTWSETVLYNHGTDEGAPLAGVVVDTAGNIFGTTENGGAYNGGTVFELTPSADGIWTQTILHNFNSKDNVGGSPGPVILDASGNLYGTAGVPIFPDLGVVFELSPAGGNWVFKVLHHFNNSSSWEGAGPGGLVLDAVGNLYGSTFATTGTLFKLSHKADGGWPLRVLYAFGLNLGDGWIPQGGPLTIDGAGNLYGTTVEGGYNGTGVVFEVKPQTNLTTIALLSSPNPSLAGQPVTFTPKISSPSGPPPDGEPVWLYDRGTPFGSPVLAGGSASFTTSSLTDKTHLITAVYWGDDKFASSTKAVTQVVNGYATSTTLASSLNPLIYGQAVTWTARVTTSGPTPPIGMVTFSHDGVSLGAAALNASGVATLTKSNLNADAFPLVAVYRGDTANQASTSAVVNQVVTQATSSAALSSSPNPSTTGQAVTFTATITSPTAKATGPVTFTAGKNVLGTGQLSGGKATFTTSTLAVGSTTVTATYLGDSDIAGSSASVTQMVQ